MCGWLKKNTLGDVGQFLSGLGQAAVGAVALLGLYNPVLVTGKIWLIVDAVSSYNKEVRFLSQGDKKPGDVYLPRDKLAVALEKFKSGNKEDFQAFLRENLKIFGAEDKSKTTR